MPTLRVISIAKQEITPKPEENNRKKYALNYSKNGTALDPIPPKQKTKNIWKLVIHKNFLQFDY